MRLRKTRQEYIDPYVIACEMVGRLRREEEKELEEEKEKEEKLKYNQNKEILFLLRTVFVSFYSFVVC